MVADFLLKRKVRVSARTLSCSQAGSATCTFRLAYFLLKRMKTTLLSVLWEDAGLEEPGPEASDLQGLVLLQEPVRRP